eukprot:CAMPEP_0117675250 /NCGR_PEP_ID=MMETSP0804-20121206/15500_1 /TAXON_ID=1074897 /ORGANISM="Tetraselmis astigmatica, Strain CCMP880" /LENGTH=271 /DNA_ID=CAMNT_0005484231 /DNA_START=124 /DNA_END=939 /DNA_ORIENTATION=+
MVHENMFHVEKHLNDTLHNPQAKGRSHTEREIVAAARVLGREPAGDKDSGFAVRGVKDRGEALGDGGVLLQQRGLVVRVETSALPRKDHPRQKRAPEPLDANNRGNMMARIQAGGTGGPAPSMAAAAYLGRARQTHVDEDTPTLVLPEEMHFKDGWSVTNSLAASTLLNGEQLDEQVEGQDTVGANPSVPLAYAASETTMMVDRHSRKRPLLPTDNASSSDTEQMPTGIHKSRRMDRSREKKLKQVRCRRHGEKEKKSKHGKKKSKQKRGG